MQTTTINIPLGSLDSKTASKLLPMGRFLDLRNIIRRKTGQLQKRYGFSAIGTNILGSNVALSNGLRLDTFNNSLVTLDGSALYSYSQASDALINRGNLVSALVDSSAVVRNTASQERPGICAYRGYACSVWEDSRGGVRYCITDDTADAFVVADQLLAANGSLPKVVAFAGQFLLTYFDAIQNKHFGRFIAVSSITTIGTAFSFTSTTNGAYDVISYNDQVAVYVFNNSTPKLSIGYLTTLGTAGTFPAAIILTDPGVNVVSLTADSTRKVFYVGYYDTTNGSNTNKVRAAAITDDFNSTAYATVEAISNIDNITATVTSTSAVRIFYEVVAGIAKNELVKQSTYTYVISGSITVGTPAVFLRSVGLASVAWSIGTSDYVNVIHQSNLQCTVFTARSDGLIVARHQPALCANLSPSVGLSRVTVDSLSRYIFAIIVKNRVLTETTSTQLSWVGIQKQALTFSSSTFNSDTLGLNLHVAAGQMWMYDGAQVVEQSYHIYPEDLSAITTTSGGHLVDSTPYQFKAMYEWVDNQGQIHRSADSIELQQTTGNSGSNINTVTLTIPTLRLTSKTNVNIVVYRIIASGATVFYRDGIVANNPAVDTVTFVAGTTTDASVSTQEILYTVGGELPNTALPSHKAVHKHKGRLFAVGLEDGLGVRYSKSQVYGEGTGFSDGLLFRTDARGGPINNCLSTLDDKLVIFKDTAIFIQVGDGPDSTGSQSDYADPQMIANDVGCTNPRSVVITPIGIMFQSAKGIRLLDRGLTVQYIGAGVEQYNNLTISSAQIMPDSNEVRFTTYTGELLAYNYEFNEWSVFDNHACQDATIYNDSYYHIVANGQINKEIPNQYNDNGTTIKMRIETGWLSLDKVQGFQRVYYVGILGDFVSHCYAKIQLATNYEDVYNQLTYFNTQTGLGTDTYGSDTTFGSSSVFGGTGSTVFQFRIKPRQQKCESMKLLIEDVDTLQTLTNGGGCFSLDSLAFEIGMKTGIKRQGVNKTVQG